MTNIGWFAANYRLFEILGVVLQYDCVSVAYTDQRKYVSQSSDIQPNGTKIQKGEKAYIISIA